MFLVERIDIEDNMPAWLWVFHKVFTDGPSLHAQDSRTYVHHTVSGPHSKLWCCLIANNFQCLETEQPGAGSLYLAVVSPAAIDIKIGSPISQALCEINCHKHFSDSRCRLPRVNWSHTQFIGTWLGPLLDAASSPTFVFLLIRPPVGLENE